MKRIITIMALALIAFTAWGQTAEQAPKMNKKNLVVKEWNTNAKGVASTLDHITTYSPEGKKIDEIEYDAAGKQKWRKKYEWGADGRMARLVNYKTFEYNEFGKKKVQYTYNAKGKLLGTKIYEYKTQE